MKHLIEELQQQLRNIEVVEQLDDMETLDQWEDYKDEYWTDDLFDVCLGITKEIDALNEYYNSL